MRQVVHCNGCNSQIPTPESIEGKPSPQFLKCETCGNELFWNGGLTDNSEPLILFSIEDSAENLETPEGMATEPNQESTEPRQSDESDLDDTNQIVDLEIKELDAGYLEIVAPEIADVEIADVEIADIEIADIEIADFEIADFEISQETPIEPASQPQSLVHAENVEEQTETSASDTRSQESEQLPSGSLEPQEHVIEQQVDLDPPNQSEQEPIVNDTVPAESFALELEIESEQDSHFSEPETHQSPTTENATDEIVADFEEEPFALGEPYLESEPNAESHAIDNAPVAELVVPVDSSPAVDWSVLGPTVPRRRPKEASAIRKILPPILGGLAAFPIATLILWYGFGKDIGTTGPTVAKYVPWIVPEKFRSMPFDSSPPNFASGRTQRSAPSTRNTLPTLNRGETIASPNDEANASAPTIASKKPEVAPEKPTTAEPKTNSKSESSVAKISESIAALRLLQVEMRNAKEGKGPIFVACQSKLKDLSKLAAELTGPSSRTWNKELEAISREILADPDIPRAMESVANKARKEIPAAVSGDFVATVIKVGEANEVSTNETWNLREKWQTDDKANPIPIEVLPGALLAGSGTLPATCMVFGRLLPIENSDFGASNNSSTGSNLVLKVHLLVPK